MTAVLLSGITGWMFGPAYECDQRNGQGVEPVLVPMGIILIALIGGGMAAAFCMKLGSSEAKAFSVLLVGIAPFVFVWVTWLTLLVGFLLASLTLALYATSRNKGLITG